MATAGPKQVILETSVLINFLKVDRVDLLARLPGQEFLITDHVRDEITQHYPQQVARLTAALQQGHLHEIQVTDPGELAAFSQLASTGLGSGECSAIAAASLRGLPLAIDDKVAVKRARQFHPGIAILNTESLMVSLIHENILDVPAADAIKDDWERNHRFRLPFQSFAERI
jgi:predicted nucleic acid-binding protein